MPRRIPLCLSFVISLCAALSGPASAQRPAWIDSLLIAANLPVVTLEARKDGVPADDIHRVLDAMRAKNVPASDAETVIDEERTARREHGPVDNFGAFVQSKLDAGMRGHDLAAAIRAEHVAHGKGNGPRAASAGAAGGSGRAGEKRGGPSTDRGRASIDTSRVHGRPSSAPSRAPATKGPPAGRPNKPMR